MKPVRFHPEAEAEFHSAVTYYEGKRKGLGISLRQEVEVSVRLIQRNPTLFAERASDGCRKCRVRRFPYAVYYMELDQDIWIAAVAHDKRQRGYWKGRSPS